MTSAVASCHAIWEFKDDPAVYAVCRSRGSRDPGLLADLRCAWGFEGVDCVWVYAAGDLDLATVAQLQRVLHAAGRGAQLVLLDVRQLTFLDIVGVRAIAVFSTRVRAAGGRVVVLRGSHRMQRMLFALPGLGPLVETVSLESPQPLCGVVRRPRAAGLAAIARTVHIGEEAA